MIIKGRAVQTMSRLILAALVCLWFGGAVAMAQPPATLPEIVVENGTVMLPVIYGNEQAVTGLLQYLQGMPEFSGMSMLLLEPKGAPAMVLLSGNDEGALRSAAEKLRGLLAEAGRPHRLVISAYLRELDISNNLTVGIDWSSMTGNATYGIQSLTRQVDLSANPAPKIDTLTHGLIVPTTPGYFGFNAQLNRSLSKSKVIMGSNLYTPNGIQGELLSQTVVPLQTTDSNGNATLTS